MLTLWLRTNDFNVLNTKALAGRIGLNPTLLSQYISGRKKPSASQSRRILYGINKIGQELSEMIVIYERKTEDRVKTKRIRGRKT